MEDRLILVGVISAAHGIRGNVVVRSHTNPPENLFNMNITDQKEQKIDLKKIKNNNKGSFICVLHNCNSRNDAEEVKGMELYCNRSELPEIVEDNEFYIEDLKGLDVHDIDGHKIAEVVNVFNFGAGDIVEIKLKEDGKLHMLPFTKEIFPKVKRDHLVCAKIDSIY